jgi:hypothetical protein
LNWVLTWHFLVSLISWWSIDIVLLLLLLQLPLPLLI